MLYEFHAEQTKKRPKSVHATYLLAGKQHSTEYSNGDIAHDGDDIAMRSSPFMSSLPEPENTPESPVPTSSIILVREEELESMRRCQDGSQAYVLTCHARDKERV